MRASGPSSWRDTFVLAAASLALYLALAQEAFHGLDVHVHVFFLTQGHLEHPIHLLYMKLVGGVWPPLRAMGLSPHHALRFLSALGTALGVLCTHRAAARLDLTRRQAICVAALAAIVPAIVFFATVAEIHGVFAAFAGAAWWAWANLMRRITVRAGAWTGMASGLAASVHATGHLLPGVLGLAALAWWRAPWRPVPSRSEEVPPALRSPWPSLAAVVAVHGLVAVGLALSLQPIEQSMPLAGQVSFLANQFANFSRSPLANLWHVVRDEWLLALFPLSILGLAALGKRECRPLAIAMALALVMYLAISCVLLHDLNERGAYFLPLAFPLALLTTWSLRPLHTVLAGVAALGLAVGQVWTHDRVIEADWVRGFAALVREQPVALICRDVVEQEAITRVVPDLPFVRVDSLLASADREEDYAQFCAVFDVMVAQFERGGRVVLITRPAYEALLATGKPFFVRFLREHLVQHYQVDEVSRDGFVALRVRT